MRLNRMKQRRREMGTVQRWRFSSGMTGEWVYEGDASIRSAVTEPSIPSIAWVSLTAHASHRGREPYPMQNNRWLICKELKDRLGVS